MSPISPISSYASNNPLTFTDPFGLEEAAENSATQKSILTTVQEAVKCAGKQVVASIILDAALTGVGVYVFMGLDGLPYVGQSKDIANRVNNGHRAAGGRLRGVALDKVKERIIATVRTSTSALNRQIDSKPSKQSWMHWAGLVTVRLAT